jgi:predicted TIM-barrel fold metal-dependent hydrolase
VRHRPAQAWLARTREAAIDPELEICDPHHHLWSHPGDRYLVEELLADTGSGHRVVETVYVECQSMYREGGPRALRPVGETEFVERVARESEARAGATRVAAGIVGHADLTLGAAVEPVLEAHLAASARFRGVRHAAARDESDEIESYMSPPTGLLASGSFREGFERVASLGLSFDAWLYHPQLPELVDLARAFPDATIVLDHVGGPLGVGPYAGRRDEVFELWRRGITEVAACPNVVVKLGGLAMPLNGFGWHERDAPPGSAELAEATRPYYLHCIEQFGPTRCMFESNFPVDRASCSYVVLWNSFKRISAGFSDAERAALFRETAGRVYRLER